MNFPYMAVGTLTGNGSTMMVTAVYHDKNHGAWLLPSVKVLSQYVYNSVGNEITEDGDYKGEYFDFVETYDLFNPISVLNNLKARQQMSPIPTTEPVYDGDSMIRVRNVYRILPDLSMVCSFANTALQQAQVTDYMFSQAQRVIGASGTVNYYVPGSKPNGTDLTKPINVAWNIDSIYLNNSWWDDENSPVNRVIQYVPYKYGFAIGFLEYGGVGKELENTTNNVFELRGDTGKVYPHGVEGSKVGYTFNIGDTYSAIMYRANINVDSANSIRLSYYHVTGFDGNEYVFADYSASGYDNINIDDKFNGRKVSIVESSGVELLTDVYTNGIDVMATYINDKTCYAVIKIEK